MTYPMRLDVVRDWGWSDGFLPEVRRILMLNSVHLFKVEIAATQQDVKQATDMLLTVSGQKAIAVRLRRAQYPYRDLTIRSLRTNGTKTELDKIRAGHGDYYLYGWTCNYEIPEWMLVDLNQLRKSGLLTQSRTIPNRDGTTGFIAIPYIILRKHKCITSANIYE